MKTSITKIKVKLADREIELSAEEARQLHAELSELFGIEKRQIDPLKPYLPVIPIIIEKHVPYWPDRWEVTCGGFVGSNGHVSVGKGYYSICAGGPSMAVGESTLCMNLAA